MTKPKYIYGNVLLGTWRCTKCDGRWYPTELEKLEVKPIRTDPKPAFKCPDGCDVELKYGEAM